MLLKYVINASALYHFICNIHVITASALYHFILKREALASCKCSRHKSVIVEMTFPLQMFATKLVYLEKLSEGREQCLSVICGPLHQNHLS